jgi:hypothetical protein
MTDHSAKPVGDCPQCGIEDVVLYISSTDEHVRKRCGWCSGVAGYERVAPVVEPHVHEPAGPGEYCTGCFDQGAVWAEFEERARIIAIIEGYFATAGGVIMKADLLAAIKEQKHGR